METKIVNSKNYVCPKRGRESAVGRQEVRESYTRETGGGD